MCKKYAIKDKYEKPVSGNGHRTHILLSSVDDIQDELFVFLKDLISPYMTDNSRETVISSIAQDICRMATNGQWKLAKLVALGMTLRPLHRSKLLLTMLNSFGHCKGYKFCTQLEVAIEEALDKTSSVLPRSMKKGPENLIFHSEWDNHDVFCQEFMVGHPSIPLLVKCSRK